MQGRTASDKRWEELKGKEVTIETIVCGQKEPLIWSGKVVLVKPNVSLLLMYEPDVAGYLGFAAYDSGIYHIYSSDGRLLYENNAVKEAYSGPGKSKSNSEREHLREQGNLLI